MNELLLYLGLAGALTLPQGGGDLRRTAGGEIRLGAYVDDNTALECTIGASENTAVLGANALMHWSVCELYDRFFGFSALDPFFTLGVNGSLGGSAGYIGPAVGVGSYYHFSDNFALRIDCSMTLDVDCSTECVYSIAAGLVYTL